LTQGAFSATDEVTVVVTQNDPEVPVSVMISENINADRWLVDIFEDPAQPDYIVTGNIEVRAKLSIDPGVVIHFAADKSLQIEQGAIIAKGTAQRGIVFMGVGNVPAYWKGVIIHSNSNENELEYVTIGTRAFLISKLQDGPVIAAVAAHAQQAWNSGIRRPL
jgi:hypothetical protein